MLTIIGLIFVWYQIREARKISKGQFLLNFDAEFRHHNEIYYRLLQHEQWDELNDKSKRAKLISYLGLFERIYSLVQDGILSIGQVDRLYGYRLDDLITHDAIFEVIANYDSKWEDLTCLIKDINEYKKEKRVAVDSILSARIDELPCTKPDWRDMTD